MQRNTLQNRFITFPEQETTAMLPSEEVEEADAKVVGPLTRKNSSMSLDLEEAVAKKDPIEDSEHANAEASRRWENNKYYNWRTFWTGGSPLAFLRWLRAGYDEHSSKQSDDEMRHNLRKLARLILLLREYYETYGMPEDGGPKDQEFVLREVTKDLYSGGAPIWTLEPAMEKAAEGLTGKVGVDFFILPRKALIFAPSSGATTMFRINRGYNIQKLTAMEQILVRIASYASNTHGVSSLPTRLPDHLELLHAFRDESAMNIDIDRSSVHDNMIDTADQSTSSQADMAAEILTLASRAEGLFFFINSKDRPDTSIDEDGKQMEAKDKNLPYSMFTQRFWKVEDHISELFSRLATADAIREIDTMDKNLKVLYPKLVIAAFRFVTSAGACAFWFEGGWIDMIMAGLCGSLVGIVSTWKFLSKEERVIFEVVASYLVGMFAGISSLLLPTQTCFGAIGLAGILDILQGFRVVYAVIELMGKHTVSGGADFLEGLLFTGLIAYALKLGEVTAEYIMGKPETDEHLQCNNGIEKWWFFIMVPITAFAWSGMFNPNYQDLPLMAYHGCLAYSISWACASTDMNSDFSLFLAAMSVTLSAGLISRFTGRQAMGNTVAGLYVLLPGAYLVNSFFESMNLEFLGTVFFSAAIIGTGAWTGTILCSPTILGTTAGLIKRQTGIGSAAERHPSVREERGVGTMLFF